jgi:SAM-dependent methyltransferase
MSSTTNLPPLAANAWLRYDVVARMLPADARTVLEIGCGQGSVGTRIAATRDYLGVEPDPTSFAAASARITALGRGEVRNGMVDDVVEAGQQFDLVCAFEVIEHLEDDAAALKEWALRIKPGGSLMISTPAFQARYGEWDAIVGHYRRYEPEQFKQLMRDAGLVDPQVVVYGAGLGEVLETGRNLIGKRRMGKSGTPMPAKGTDGDVDASTMAHLTSGSGRLLQPPPAAAMAVQVATAPFRALQRKFPNRGTGLVATARKP